MGILLLLLLLLLLLYVVVVGPFFVVVVVVVVVVVPSVVFLGELWFKAKLSTFVLASVSASAADTLSQNF